MDGFRDISASILRAGPSIFAYCKETGTFVVGTTEEEAIQGLRMKVNLEFGSVFSMDIENN